LARTTVSVLPSGANASWRVIGPPCTPATPRMVTAWMGVPVAAVIRDGAMPWLMIVLLLPRMMLFTTVVWL
jgi:hypothetical protein